MRSSTWYAGLERLDRVLPELRLARSRSQAAELIASGRVFVDGAEVRKTGARVATGAVVSVNGVDHYVSRAAHKLIAGLDEFGIDPTGRLALDVGASTGGFTQVLLERGARQVLAIDVGHGQLAESIGNDARVRSVEGCNARELTRESLASATGVQELPELIVGDLSFISLDLVMPALVGVAAVDAEFVLLIKPQFEVGRQGVNGGIVVDHRLSVAAVARVIQTASGLGLRCLAVAASPIRGEHGNQEVLAHFAREEPVDPTEWELAIREIFEAGGEL